MKILHVVGARPNFIKLAPIFHEINSRKYISQLVMHTGQHYSEKMSAVFFKELDLGKPDINLNIGSDTQARQVGRMMIEMDKAFGEIRPDAILVYGDVNSTLAATLVSSKIGIYTAHVEAGLRSFDRTMPEEINRIVTDALVDLLLTPSVDASQNLLREGIDQENIILVGNVMIDSVVNMLKNKIDLSGITSNYSRYGIVTLHRPFNVDDPERLLLLIQQFALISQDLPLVFPLHPRTRKTIEQMDICHLNKNLVFLDPLPYSTFIHLIAGATLVITDSGGIQEETTFLKVPCVTLRKNTERPVTCDIGTNTLVGDSLETMNTVVFEILAGKYKEGNIPPLWDGHTAARIVDILLSNS